MRPRPVTTLFMLMSVDGKITDGATDNLDFDQDFPEIAGVREGLQQYYDIQETTDLWSFNTGRVQAKVGVNEKPIPDHAWSVSFVLMDNRHLTAHGIEYFCALSKNFVLVTSNPDHPGFKIKHDNFHILYHESLDLGTMLEDLREQFDCQRLTIQSGGTVNGLLLREHLLDYLDVVVAPVLVGGKDTSSLINGPSLVQKEELKDLGILKLINAQKLNDSYLRLQYQITNGRE